MKSLLLLVIMPLAYSLSTYTCWNVKHEASTWAACTTNLTIPIPFKYQIFIEENHIDTFYFRVCVEKSDRKKGRFIDIPNSWAWITASDLYDSRPCTFNEIFKAEVAQGIYDNFGEEINCLEPGLYTPKTFAKVTGKGTKEPHQYLGTLRHGQTFTIVKTLNENCVWCHGIAGHPISLQRASVLCSDLQPLYGPKS